MAFDKYRHYFDIDPDYFPAVNEAVINNNPSLIFRSSHIKKLEEV